MYHQSESSENAVDTCICVTVFIIAWLEFSYDLGNLNKLYWILKFMFSKKLQHFDQKIFLWWFVVKFIDLFSIILLQE